VRVLACGEGERALNVFEDLEMPERIIKVGTAVLQAFAIVVTAFYASRGLRAWRGQLIGKRKFEVAEEILVGAHKAKANLAFVRNPVTFTKPGATPRDTYNVTFERLQQISSELAEFEKTRVLADVHIGSEAAQVISAILQNFHDVAASARLPLLHVDNPFPMDEHERKAESDRRNAWEFTIWGSANDELTQAVDKGISRLEVLCRPYLKAASWPHRFWIWLRNNGRTS